MSRGEARSNADPQIQYDCESMHIEYGRLFGADVERLTRRFVGRVLILPEVHSVSIDPHANAASVSYRVDKAKLSEFIESLAAAIDGSGAEMDDSSLPHWSADAPITLHRFEGLVSRWKIASKSAGHIQMRHPALTRDANFARRAENQLRSISGVTEATATNTMGNLWVRFQPELVTVKDLIRIAESQLDRPVAPPAFPNPQPVDFRMANTTVGVATVGELLIPLAEALGAGLLVVSQLNTMRDAAMQLRQGKIGTPVWLSALLFCSIASGQVLAYALTDWSFRYWTRRCRRDLATESRVFIEETAPIPSHARIQSAPNIEVWTPVEQIRPGQSLIAQTGDIIAVDGRVVSGVALVHEGPHNGTRTSVCRVPADEVFAGSTIVHGKLEIEPMRVGQDTQNARIARVLLKSTASLADHRELKQQTEALVDRTASPTLATAGIGLAVGDLFTAGAILHQDWLSGAELAVSLETLRAIRVAAGMGALILEPGALSRLGKSNFVVLEDCPSLLVRGLEIHQLQSRLKETETDSLLPYIAGAGLYLGDERAIALTTACQRRGLLVHQPSLFRVDTNLITIRQGRHTVTLRSWPEVSAEPAPPLTVEIDGAEVASLQFRHQARPKAANWIFRLRQLGYPVFLVSDRSNREAQETAALLGIELYSGELSTEKQTRFMLGLRRRGVRAIYLGDFGVRSSPAREAYVSVSSGFDGFLRDETADIVFPSNQIGSLPEVARLAREHPARIKATGRQAMVPNLLCVIGGFGGVLNGISAGILANIAVLGVYRRAIRSLQSIDNARDSISVSG